jgi:hypothetical protein
MKSIFLLFLAVAILRADDITTTDGKVYKNATVLSHTASAVTLTSDSGPATFPLSKLDPGLVKKLHDQDALAAATSDQETAALAKINAEQQARAKAQAAQIATTVHAEQTAQLAATAVILSGTLIRRIHGNGLLIDCEKPTSSPPVRGAVYGHYVLVGHPQENFLADDDAISVRAIPFGTFAIDGGTYRAYRYFDDKAPKPTETAASSPSTGSINDPIPSSMLKR